MLCVLKWHSWLASHPPKILSLPTNTEFSFNTPVTLREAVELKQCVFKRSLKKKKKEIRNDDCHCLTRHYLAICYN